jgi:hypothetical protein
MNPKPGAPTPDDQSGEFEDLIPEGAEVLSPRLEQSQADDSPSGDDLEDGDANESDSDRAGDL